MREIGGNGGGGFAGFDGGGGGQNAAGKKTLRQRDYVLPNVIDYDDFYDAAFDEGMVEIEEVLAKNKVPVRGEGDRRYLRRTDLLRLCGKDCSYDKGWGIFLSQFAVQRHRR